MKKTKSSKNLVPNLKRKYDEEIIPAMKERFGLKNSWEVPRLEKIVVNVGIGSGGQGEAWKQMEEDIKKITGQAPVYTVARKAISGFKVREGMKVGMKVTLRGRRMWEFLERIIVAAFPRIKDFQGIPKKNFDESGSVSVGIKEHVVFPEINADEVNHTFGLQVSLVLKEGDKEKGIELMRLLGFPVQK